MRVGKSAHLVLGPQLSPGWGRFFLSVKVNHMKSILIIAALLFSASAFAQDAPKVFNKPGAGETEGARSLQTTGHRRRYETVGRGLCCERAEAKRSACANRC